VDDFLLALHLPRAEIRLGEPLVLVVSLENRSGEVKEVVDLLAPEHGFLVAWLRRPGEDRETTYAPPVRRDTRLLPRATLDAGERITARLPIFFGRDGWLLDRPGRYRVRAEYSWDERKAASEAVEFEVAAPATEADRRAAALMTSREVGSFLYLLGGRQADVATDRLETVAREHAACPPAPFARLALGLWASRESFDPEIKDFRPADPSRAVEDLEWALARLDDPLLAADGTASLAFCLRSLGREEEAAGVLERFSGKFAPESANPALRAEVRRALEGRKK